MPLQPISGFTNPDYALASTQASAQRALNVFSEVVESGSEKMGAYLRGREGLSAPLVTLPTSPLRALQECGSPLSAASRCFAVAGNELYEVFANGTYALRRLVGTVTVAGAAVTWASGSVFVPFMANQPIFIGGLQFTVLSVASGTSLTLTTTGAVSGSYSTGTTIGNDGLPAQLFPNGNQVGIVSAGQFYCDNGLGPVAPQFPGSSYQDITVGWGSNPPGTGTCTVTGGSSTGLLLNLPVPGIGANDPPFNMGMVGLNITIMTVGGGGPNYSLTVRNVPSPTQLTLSRAIPHGTYTYYLSASSLMISSASNQFTQADVGATLAFPGGGSTFFLVNVSVASVDAFGNAHTVGISGGPAQAGVTGSTGGVATETFGPILARTGAFLDSFFAINPPYSKKVYVSAPLDGTNWDPTDVATKESYPDNIGALLADHQELLILGESHSEVWVAPGANPIFPFQPNESYAMALGTAAPWSACSMRDGPVWIGSSLRGQPVAYMAQGFQPQRISTHAIEQAWDKFPVFPGTTLKAFDATAFVYELDGHEFWQVTFPTADQTWVYDRTASMQMGKPMWHERSSGVPYTDMVIGATGLTVTSALQPFTAGSVGPLLITGGAGFTAQLAYILSVAGGIATVDRALGVAASTGGTGVSYHRHRSACSAFVFGATYAGDFAATGYGAGNIYRMSDQVFQDNGQPIICQRVFPHLCEQRLRQFFLKLQLDLATSSVPLTIIVDFSDNGGISFQGGGANFIYATNPLMSIDRAVFWQLGSATDRIFRITVYGLAPNAPIALINAYLDTLQGYS